MTAANNTEQGRGMNIAKEACSAKVASQRHRQVPTGSRRWMLERLGCSTRSATKSSCGRSTWMPLFHRIMPHARFWAFVQSMDLAPLYASIKSRQGGRGAPAIDPAILVSLWLWATIDGVGSAREVDRLCERDDAYRWLCGGVGVNYHTLASPMSVMLRAMLRRIDA